MDKIHKSLIDILGGEEAALAAWDAAASPSPLQGEETVPELLMETEMQERGAEHDGQGRQLAAYNYNDFIARKTRPRRLLLSPFLPQAGLSMLYAMRGVGKTHVALGMAWAVASGGRFLRWQAETPARALYIDGEMPAPAMQERIRQLRDTVGGEPPEADYFRIITPDFQTCRMPDIATREGQAMIEEYLDGVELVVIDNLSTLCRRVKENEADSWEPVQEWALSLRQRGKSLLIVHHAGRSGQARGTSRREDILDSVLLLKRPEDYRPLDGARFEVHYEKARGFYGDEAAAFEARLEQVDRELRWTMQDIGVTRQDSARRLVARGITHNEAAKRLGVSRSAVTKWVGHAATAPSPSS